MTDLSTEAPPTGAAPRNHRWTLIAIFAVCAAPLVLGTLAYYFFPAQGRTNYGELLAPIGVPTATMQTLDGKPFALGDLKGKWILLHVDDARCAEACEQKLYKMRQSRTAQGKEMSRVERVWILAGEPSAKPDGRLMEQYEGTHIVRGSDDMVNFFPATAGSRAHIYVIDPLGNLMMRFPPDADPRKMIKDLSRLLRASRVG